MRKLMWFAIGFAVACGAGVYQMPVIWLILLGLFCLGAFAVSLLRKTVSEKVTAAVCIGCVVGLLWFWGYDRIYLSEARAMDGEMQPVTITASDYSYDTDYGKVFDGRVKLGAKTYQVRTYLDEKYEICPGDQITGTFSHRYTADGDERNPNYYQSKGIFLLAYQESEIEFVQKSKRSLLEYPAIIRQKILLLIEQVFPEDTAGFAKALLLGDSSELTYEQERSFQVSGIRHVIAVSGLHISILFACIYWAFGHQRVLNAIFGIPLLLLFAAVAGFNPSIVRACIMQCLMLLAMLLDKEYDPPTALAFAALVILGVNPRAFASISFQLSVGCMIGIFLFSGKTHKYLLSFGNLQSKSKGNHFQAKVIRWVVGSVSVTVSATVVTTPLCAVYFGLVSLVGIFTNLLTLWIVSFIFYGIMLACVLALFFAPAGQLIAWVIAWPVRYVLVVSGFLAKFPLAAVYTDSIYIVLWLICSYLLLTIFLIMQKKQPLVIAAAVYTLLCVSIFLSWQEPKRDETRVSVIDVGQGQSILFQQGQSCYLVDCGGANGEIVADKVANFLLSQGVFHLDGVILTHYDADHAASVLPLLTVVPADRIYMPDTNDSNGVREGIIQVYPDRIQLISKTSCIETDGGNFTLFPSETLVDDNESSVCVLFQTENCDILITGDRSRAGERALLRQVQLPQLELLIAGHHGSNTATSFDLLFATQPQAVAISVGEDNIYGHPGQDMLERLAHFGCQVYRTDLEGTIVFRR